MMKRHGLNAKVGDICTICNATDETPILAEVVGFKKQQRFTYGYSDIKGIGPGDIVESTGSKAHIRSATLMGRTIDSMGRPIDGLGPFEIEQYYNVDATYTNPLGGQESIPA